MGLQWYRNVCWSQFFHAKENAKVYKNNGICCCFKMNGSKFYGRSSAC